MLAYFGCLSILNKFVHSFCFAQFQVNYANSRFEFGRGHPQWDRSSTCESRSTARIDQARCSKKEQKVNTFDG